VWQLARQKTAGSRHIRRLAGASFVPILALSAIVGAPLVAGTPALAQATAKTKTGAQNRLKKSRAELKQTETRVETIRANVNRLIAERAEINARLLATGKLIQDAEGRMTATERRIDQLGQQREALRRRLGTQNSSLAKLLAAMQRMGRNPPPVIVTQRSDALKMVRSAMLLARAFPELKGQADVLAAQLKALVRVMVQHKNEGKRLRNEAIRLNDARTRLAALVETKRQSLNARKLELEEVRRTAKLITRNVANLSALIAKLDQAVARKTRLGAYNATVKPEKAPAEHSRNPKIAFLTPPKIQRPSAIELLPGTGNRAANAGRLTPAVPFYRAKATLPLPAHGRSVIKFGDRTQYGGHSKGQVIKTRYSAQITSPCDGWVVYAGEFRSYGQLLIINAGAGYHVLLAGLTRIDVQLGQFVLAAEPVGSMSGAPRGGSKANAPVLYVEFRKNGKAIDPSPWWAKGQQRVQG